MPSPIDKDLLAKYKAAESLTRGELSQLYYYYDGLRRAFEGYTPPEYSLIKTDVHMQFDRLTDMVVARNCAAIRKSVGLPPESYRG